MMPSSNEINVSKYIIKNSPVGHLTTVLKNIADVCGESIIATPQISSEILNHIEDHFCSLRLPNTQDRAIISKYNKLDSYYIDQSKNIKYKPNSEFREAIDIQQIPITNNELRSKIEKIIYNYIKKYYKNETTYYNIYYDEANGKINIIISSHHLKYKSFWSGEWNSIFEYFINMNKIKGKIMAKTYYYEEGNIQFHLEDEYEGNIDGGNEDDVANGIVGFIEGKENECQDRIDKVYDKFAEQYIKPLRRKLPVTKTKMNWNMKQLDLGII